VDWKVAADPEPIDQDIHERPSSATRLQGGPLRGKNQHVYPPRTGTIN
jgi:hypothetical protein